MTCLYFSDLTSADGFVFPITVHQPFVLLFCYLCRHLCMTVAVYVVRVRVSGLILFVPSGYRLGRRPTPLQPLDTSAGQYRRTSAFR